MGTYRKGYISFFMLLCVLSACRESSVTIDHPGPTAYEVNIVGDIDLNGEVAWDANIDSVFVRIRAKNIGDQDARIEYGPCSFRVLAYSPRIKDQKLVWYNSLPDNHICLDVLEIERLSPNESRELRNLGNLSGKNWILDLPDSDLQFFLLVNIKNGSSRSFALKSTPL